MKSTRLENGQLPQHAPTKRAGDPVLLDAVTAHLERHVGPVAGVLPDPDSRWAHVDLLVMPPAEGRPVLVLSTCGMAERPLQSVTGERVWTELLMFLPAAWPLRQPALGEPRHLWPFTYLRWLARFPHQTGVGYRVGDDVGPIPQSPDAPRPTPFDSVLLVEQPVVPPLAMTGREVAFLAVCPLHPSELTWKREQGAKSVLQAFERAGLEPMRLDPARRSLAPR